MRFGFWRKLAPEPPRSAAEQRLVALQGMRASGGPVGRLIDTGTGRSGGPTVVGVVSGATLPGQGNTEPNRATNPRFRSFAERYVIERCAGWAPDQIDESAWATILQARSVYNKIKEQSYNVPD